MVDHAGVGLERGPRHEEPHDVEAVRGHRVPVRIGDRDDRREVRVGLVVVAERVEVHPAQDDAPAAVVDDGGVVSADGVQRTQSRTMGCGSVVVARRGRARERGGDEHDGQRDGGGAGDGHGRVSGGVGILKSFTAFCQQMRLTSSSGTSRSWSRSRGWVSGQVESAWG